MLAKMAVKIVMKRPKGKRIPEVTLRRWVLGCGCTKRLISERMGLGEQIAYRREERSGKISKTRNEDYDSTCQGGVCRT